MLVVKRVRLRPEIQVIEQEVVHGVRSCDRIETYDARVRLLRAVSLFFPFIIGFALPRTRTAENAIRSRLRETLPIRFAWRRKPVASWRSAACAPPRYHARGPEEPSL
jgi:hypothetical protein